MVRISLKKMCIFFFILIPILSFSANDEFLVNTYTTGDQLHPSVAMDDTGNFVIVWESFGQDSSDFGIFAQRFDSAGNPIRNEFQVNTYTNDIQWLPSVAMDSSGNFVITWLSMNQDGSGSGIFAKRYDNAGNLLGSEFQVNTYTESTQRDPDIAMNSAGNFIITWWSWEQDGSNYGIFAQRFDNNCDPVGNEFQVNTYTESMQGACSSAMDSNGDFVITWQSINQDGSGYGVYAQRFDSEGNRVGDEFQVNTYISDSQWYPSTAMDGDGNFVISWASGEQDGSGYGVFAQRYDNNGNPIGNEFQVNKYTTDHQGSVSASMDNKGDFIITWDSNGQDGSEYGVFAKIYDKNGNLFADEFQVNLYTEGNQGSPSVAINNNGDFIIAWNSINQYSPDSSGDIYARLYQDSIPPEPKVDIYANGTSFGPGDTIEISVRVDNPFYGVVDMYAAISLGGSLFWYPLWDETPHRSEINTSLWDEKIGVIPLSSNRPLGIYTFYAAITEYKTYDVIGVDSVTITIE